MSNDGQESTSIADKMLNLREAAEQLGYKPSGLREIVDRTRKGKQGATIQFFQVGKGPIRFKQDWLDEFVAANSIAPGQVTVQQRPRQRRKPFSANTVQIEKHWNIAS